jgi:hypothetical protein
MKSTPPILFLLILLCFGLSTAHSATHYVANDGSDAASGTLPDAPWRTVARVNAFKLAPGDAVLFRRGDRWREQLVPHSGSEAGCVTYSAYGTGEKPLLLGSINESQPGDWHHEGGSIWVCGPGDLSCDVGNIIFNHDAVCGVKVFNEAELKQQGQYWYDEDRHVVKLHSARSPAEHYSDIECALRRHIIDQSTARYVVYDGLALKYGAAHGIGGHNTHHITTRNCDFGYIGGGDQMGGDGTVRFGNGVEFWAGAHDNVVENCRFWEIYDAAMTNQNGGAVAEQYNLVYRNNVVRNCEYSFEYWNRPAESSTHDVIFENNTCVNAGGGWGHAQRPDQNGRHLCFYSSPAQARGIHIRNNIFYQATNNAFFLHHWSDEAIRALDMQGNCWYQPTGAMIRLIGPGGGEEYSMDQFSAFQAKYGLDKGSIAADPGLVDPAKGDFRLKPDSPCPWAGTMPVKKE